MNDFITNGAEIKQRIISEINAAQQQIHLAMAWFTDRDIATAIIEAKNRNIYIDIILSSNVQNETVRLMLKGAGVNVHAFDTGDPRGLMHHKFCLIDDKVSINGSYNYSYNASTNNVENIQVSDDPSTYRQLFAEFERLKYNIDHNIAVNQKAESNQISIQMQPISATDSFSKRLNNLLFLATQIDTKTYIENGYTASKDHHGNIDIFRTEYRAIKERIKSYATDEGLGSKKNVLMANVSSAYQDAKSALEEEKQCKVNTAKSSSHLEKQQIESTLSTLIQERSILQSGDASSGEIGLLQINKEIEKNKLERRDLEQSFETKKFWTIGTVFILIGLLIFIFYLSVFFASALYKVFFESNIIRAALEAGINPGVPQIVDANAILKIFRSQGTLFGLIATLFFLIPVLLSNLKILGSENKNVNKFMFIVGLLLFDIVVSIMVTMNIDEIESLLLGKESQLRMWQVYQHGEFWLIFVFGMLPLIVTHFLIENITNAYKKSQREIVNAEKHRKIQLLEKEMIDLNAEKERLLQKIKEKEAFINEKKASLQTLETELSKLQNQIEEKYAEMIRQIKSTFDSYMAKITSGKIFTDVILDTVVASYKSGFIAFLPEYYAEHEVANRVREIEKSTELN